MCITLSYNVFWSAKFSYINKTETYTHITRVLYIIWQHVYAEGIWKERKNKLAIDCFPKSSSKKEEEMTIWSFFVRGFCDKP